MARMGYKSGILNNSRRGLIVSKSPQDCRLRVHDGRSFGNRDCKEKDEWERELKALYRGFYKEDGKRPPKKIVPFNNAGTLVRFSIGNGYSIRKGRSKFGMATIVLCPNGLGTHMIGRIEDVFIEPDFRRQGYGERLIQFLIETVTRQYELLGLELRSKPEREAANAFYRAIGFELIATANPALPNGTNVYWMSL